MKPITLLAALAPLSLGACAALFGSASPFALDRKGDLVEFNYAWSAEASRQPALVRQLRRDLEASFAATTAAAHSDRADAKATGRPFRSHSFSRRWTTAGQSSRLLSLDGRTSTFTGGAHANHGSKALLWDRRLGREVTLASLLASPQSLTTLLRPAYCSALDAERLRRRGPAMRAGGPFADCPRLDQLTLVPADRDRDGRFETLRMIAAPYLAGPFTEGYYVIDQAISARVRSELKPAYRASFEGVQPQ
jgi:hypothetical protein